MEINLYALEKQVESKLREAREVRARAALVSALRPGSGSRSSVIAALATTRAGRWLVRRVAREDARRVAAPTAP